VTDTAGEAGPNSPTDLRKRSWWQTLKRTLSEFQDDNLTDWAAALTYYSVLSVFPALIALVSIVGLVADPAQTTRAITDVVRQLAPGTASETFSGPIQELTSDRRAAGVLLVVGLAASLWTASGYVGAFIRASNDIYEVREGRPFWKLRPLQILVTLTMVLMLAVVVIALAVSGPVAEAVGAAIGADALAVTAWKIAKWPALVMVVVAMFAVLYYASPNVKLPGFKWITPGSLLALVMWIVASVAFAVYVGNFGSYDKTYGTLGGVITFLVWLWISNIAILLGMELNAELERSREIEAGTPGAERELQLEPRQPPGDEDQPQTA
jgi:membrane protein